MGKFVAGFYSGRTIIRRKTRRTSSLWREAPVFWKTCFRCERTGVSEEDGRVLGCFRGAGELPQCLERLRLAGITISPKLFEETTVVQ